MDKRAVVLEVGARHATVLVDGGAVRKVPLTRGAVSVGQQIFVPGEPTSNLPMAAAAAALGVALVGGGLLMHARALPTAVGVVSVDINPSIDLAFSQSGNVVSVTGLDPAGVRLAGQQNMVGESVPAAVRNITLRARQDGYLTAKNPIVMLAGGVDLPTAASSQAVQNVLRQADQAALKALSIASERVVVLPLASQAEVKAAATAKVSLGRYLVAKIAGISITQAGKESIPRLLGKWPGPSQTHKPVTPVGTKKSKSQSKSHGAPPPVTKTSPGPPSPGGTTNTTNVLGNATGTLTNTVGNTPGGTGSGLSTEPPATVPGFPGHQQKGNLDGLGPGVIVVDGIAYALAPYARVKAGGHKEALSLPLILQAISHPVTLKFNAEGQVVLITVKNLKVKESHSKHSKHDGSSGNG